MIHALRSRFTDDDLAPGLIFVGLVAFACMTPAQNDTFWHLRSGQYMWQTGSFLVEEPFSHSSRGTALYAHWWLSQLAFYLVYSLGGPFLLTVLAGSCALAAVVGSWRLMRGSSGFPPGLEAGASSPEPRVPAWELRLGLLAWLMVVTAGEWSIRPQVVSLALLVLTAHLINRDRLAWLPVVCLFWANAHAMVVLGVAMSGAAAIEALLWSRSEAKRAVTVALACVAVPVISPLGWNYWPHALLTVSVSRELRIQEYQMPLSLGDLPFWAMLGVLVVLAFLSRHTLGDRSRADRTLLIASFILAIAAVTAVRNVAFFAVVAAPVVSRFWPVRASRRRVRPAGAVAWGIMAAGVVASALVVATVWRDHGARLGWQPMSRETIAAVRRCPDPIFNQMVDGGFLMWTLPDRLVFADSRLDAYPLALLLRSRQVDLGGDHRALFRDYQFGCAIVTTDSLLREHLADDPSMTLIQSDATRSVFARVPTPAN